ncbi:hypothetical protein KKA72_02160, partial [Patescibacteria group bacterium]|nr:hypothetical protein [Patescibacteria group bacterium]
LSRIILSKKEINKFLEILKTQYDNSPDDFEELILESLRVAKKRENEIVTQEDLLIALAIKNKILKKLLIDLQLKIDDIENLADWSRFLQKKRRRAKKMVAI